jgi:glycosyltransferase involved in cell wall biosynthesis
MKHVITSSMASPSLTVLIPTHGRPRLLERTLSSLTECTLPDSYRELVVIENGSRSGAEQIVEDLPERMNARYMHREWGNKSYTLNEALKTIDDGLVVFFDDDVRVHPDTLVKYSAAGQKHENRCVYFGGSVEVDRETEPPEWFESFLPSSARGYDVTPSRLENWYLGFNWAAFLSDIERLGGFDLRFGPGAPSGATGQESDMQARMRGDGMRPIDVKGARVTHHVPEENCTFPWLLKRRYRGGIRPGIELDADWASFSVRILWRTVISLGVAGKGVIMGDREKMVFVLLNFCERAGVLKGYVWQSLNGTRIHPQDDRSSEE